MISQLAIPGDAHSPLSFLGQKYQVRDITLNYDPIDFTEDAVLRLTKDGLERLLSDLCYVDHSEHLTKEMPIVELGEDAKSGVVLVELPVTLLARQHLAGLPRQHIEETKRFLESSGYKVFLKPKDIDVSVLGVDELTQMRDSLTELIDSLSYDNIAGF